MNKKEKHKKVQLVKKFRNYEDKIIYEGTLRGALKRIPDGKQNQYEIIHLDD